MSNKKGPSFTIPAKKTALQRQREEEEKKRKADEEAAKVYEDFVASFSDANESAKAKGFVRGETINRSASADPSATASSQPTSTAAAALKAAAKLQKEEEERFYIPKKLEEALVMEEANKNTIKDRSLTPEGESQTTGDNQGPPAKKKKRDLDEFLEEIKRVQAARDGRLQLKPNEKFADVDYVEQKGSFDAGDPTTTNLYLGNLNPMVTEDLICREFGVFGPIASVKIMWPRTEEERERNRNSGFVSFMDRKSAEKALSMDGREILGYEMKVGWGKAVPLPPTPIYDINNPALSSVKFPFGARASTKEVISKQPVPLGAAKVVPTNILEIVVEKPTDLPLLRRIHRMIEFVVNFGPRFEAMVMDKEWANPDFRFLLDNQSPEHVYYRWKLFSILQGDPIDSWKEEPFYMFKSCPIWVPPVCPKKDDMAEGRPSKKIKEDDKISKPPRTGRDEKSKSEKRFLSSRELEDFNEELFCLSLEREDILDATVFAMDHAEGAVEVIDLITDSILLPTLPMFAKIAHLYLISDILHNSSLPIPNAWRYRAEFELKLAQIFEHLGSLYLQIDARLRAEQVKNYILKALKAWEKRMIYATPTLEGWAKPFLGSGTLANFIPPPPAGAVLVQAKKGFVLASATTEVPSLLPATYHDDDEDVPMETNEEELEDIDGEPM